MHIGLRGLRVILKVLAILAVRILVGCVFFDECDFSRLVVNDVLRQVTACVFKVADSVLAGNALVSQWSIRFVVTEGGSRFTICTSANSADSLLITFGIDRHLE